MSSDLIAIAFDGLNTAKEVLREVQALAAEGNIVLEEVAVAERGQGEVVNLSQGEARDVETAEVGGGLSLLLPLLYGSSLASQVTGAGLGQILERLRGYNIDQQFVAEVGESLAPDSSAIFMLLTEDGVENALDILKPYEGRVLRTTLDEAQEKKLRKTLR